MKQIGLFVLFILAFNSFASEDRAWYEKAGKRLSPELMAKPVHLLTDDDIFQLYHAFHDVEDAFLKVTEYVGEDWPRLYKIVKGKLLSKELSDQERLTAKELFIVLDSYYYGIPLELYEN